MMETLVVLEIWLTESKLYAKDGMQSTLCKIRFGLILTEPTVVTVTVCPLGSETMMGMVHLMMLYMRCKAMQM